MLKENDQPEVTGLTLDETLPQLLEVRGIGSEAVSAVCSLIAALGEPGAPDHEA